MKEMVALNDVCCTLTHFLYANDAAESENKPAATSFYLHNFPSAISLGVSEYLTFLLSDSPSTQRLASGW
jgi:hypothetical protein